MKLLYEKNNLNGFKILLASKVSDVNINLAEVKEIRSGAQLEYCEEGIIYNIDPNSAVLKLFNLSNSPFKVEDCHLKWIDWEVLLQETLYIYYQSLSGKEDKVATDALKIKLNYLNSKLISKYIIDDSLSPVDIIIYVNLVSLWKNNNLKKLLENYSEIIDYINRLQQNLVFKEVEILYYGEKGVTLEGWTNKVLQSSKSCTLNLLKGPATEGSCKPSSSSTSAAATNSSSPSDEATKVTEDEIKEAKIIWEEPTKAQKKRPTRSVNLPVEGENNILITSALPYVNNVPHLGNIIGCVLSADCFARFCRLRGDNVLYICGTDEYGTATETKALAENLTPQQICDKYYAIHCDVYNWFNIKFDYFGRTTTKSQTIAAQSIFWDLYNNGKINRNTTEQLFCNTCPRFLADRFAEGTCPHPGCGYEDARGDQCDKCGKLVNATELINPRCKICSSPPLLKKSNHLFIDLPGIQDDLKEWIKDSSPQWTPNAKVICESWLRDGLKERCITRDLKWGTPVPLDGFKDKVFYVWFDAPIGYVSITMEYIGSQWQKWWQNQKDVRYYQFMAKDNVPFHGVIFPSCQIGTKQPWTKVTHLIATEYLNYEDGKFSKSRGVGVFGHQAKGTGITSDVWRFYLLYLRPEAHDTTFSWLDLQLKNNTELLNNLGNFVNRTLKFVYQFYGGEIPPASPIEADYKVIASVNKELDQYIKALSFCKLRDGIRKILLISKIGNQYIQENEPYKLIKPDCSEHNKKRGATVINISINLVAAIAVLIEPYIPDTSKTILDILNSPESISILPTAITQFLPAGHRIKEPWPLIRKITDDEIETLRKQFAGSAAKPESVAVNKEVSHCNDIGDIEELETLVTKQGQKVRDMKVQGATKDTLGLEIESLLQLKEKLAIAQGIDPATVRGGSKKIKKKK